MTKKKRNPRHIRAELNLDSREFAIIERAARLKNLPVAVFVRQLAVAASQEIDDARKHVSQANSWTQSIRSKKLLEERAQQ
jgi:hypothetical protein